MEIYVTRHGLTELNKKKVTNGQIDEPLAAEGVAQAEAALALMPQVLTTSIAPLSCVQNKLQKF